MFKPFIYAAVATFVIAPTFDCAQAAVFNRPTINLPQPSTIAPRPMVTAPRPAVSPASTAGLTATTTVTHVGRYTEDTTTYTNQSGKVVMATSSIAPTPTNMPPGTVAPTGLIFTLDQSGRIVSARKIGGPAPVAPTSSGPITLSQNATGGSTTSGFGGSGLSQNTTNSKQAQQGHNITNTPPATQAHQGKNCTVWLHQNGLC
jgi:hypothetical protein